MLTLTPQMKIFVAIDPVDFRNGIDGMIGICRNRLLSDPLSGGVFVFKNRSGHSVKVLYYDGQGFWLCQKRLSEGRFRFWPRSGSESNQVASLLARELAILLWNGNPQDAATQPDWKKIS